MNIHIQESPSGIIAITGDDNVTGRVDADADLSRVSIAYYRPDIGAASLEQLYRKAAGGSDLDAAVYVKAKAAFIRGWYSEIVGRIVTGIQQLNGAPISKASSTSILIFLTELRQIAEWRGVADELSEVVIGAGRPGFDASTKIERVCALKQRIGA